MHAAVFFLVPEYTGDIRQIVHQAVAELSIEQHLKTYEEVWLSKVFELREHVTTSSVNRDVGQDKVEQSDGGTSNQVIRCSDVSS